MSLILTLVELTRLGKIYWVMFADITAAVH